MRFVELVGTFNVLKFFLKFRLFLVFDYRAHSESYFRYQRFIIDDKFNMTRQSSTPIV